MAKHETLGSLFTDIADQLREKVGKYTISFLQTSELNQALFQSYYSMCYGGGKFVVVGDDGSSSTGGVAACSSDGKAWTVHKFNSGDMKSVCHGNDRFVAVGADDNTVAYSFDGLNWTEVITNEFVGESVCFGNGLFVTCLGYYSEDGAVWQSSETLSVGSDFEPRVICYGEGKFVIRGGLTIATGSIAIVGGEYAGFSLDGIHWDTVRLPTASAASEIGYGNGRFVVAETRNEGEVGSYSEDGINWILTSSAPESTVFDGSKFVAWDGTSTMRYSKDGFNWVDGAAVKPDNSYYINAHIVCYGSGVYVAIGFSGADYGNHIVVGTAKGESFISADNFPDVIAELSPFNIAYGATPPSDTSKLWVPLEAKPASVEVSLDSLPSAVELPLDENYLKIFATGVAGEGGQIVSLVNWPGSSLKLKVIATYLGDADGYAAAQEAYIYDTEAAAWKSLSGSVYTG